MQTVYQWAKTLPDEFLKCRDRAIGHRWEPNRVWMEKSHYVEEIVCDRCDAIKERWLNSRGKIKKQRIVQYPKGYLSPLGRITVEENDAIRAERMRRSVVTMRKVS